MKRGGKTREARIIKTTHEPVLQAEGRREGGAGAACLSISITRLRVREGMVLSGNRTHGSWMVQASAV